MLHSICICNWNEIVVTLFLQNLRISATIAATIARRISILSSSSLSSSSLARSYLSYHKCPVAKVDFFQRGWEKVKSAEASRAALKEALSFFVSEVIKQIILLVPEKQVAPALPAEEPPPTAVQRPKDRQNFSHVLHSSLVVLDKLGESSVSVACPKKAHCSSKRRWRGSFSFNLFSSQNAI